MSPNGSNLRTLVCLEVQKRIVAACHHHASYCKARALILDTCVLHAALVAGETYGVYMNGGRLSMVVSKQVLFSGRDCCVLMLLCVSCRGTWGRDGPEGNLCLVTSRRQSMNRSVSRGASPRIVGFWRAGDGEDWKKRMSA